MICKRSAPMSQAWMAAESPNCNPSSRIARLVESLKRYIKAGYQDESGFHIGMESAEPESKWPWVW